MKMDNIINVLNKQLEQLSKEEQEIGETIRLWQEDYSEVLKAKRQINSVIDQLKGIVPPQIKRARESTKEYGKRRDELLEVFQTMPDHFEFKHFFDCYKNLNGYPAKYGGVYSAFKKYIADTDLVEVAQERNGFVARSYKKALTV